MNYRDRSAMSNAILTYGSQSGEIAEEIDYDEVQSNGYIDHVAGVRAAIADQLGVNQRKLTVFEQVEGDDGELTVSFDIEGLNVWDVTAIIPFVNFQ
jgi:hypothetical protein